MQCRYHVTNFFAPSSRFGTPDDLKSLIDKAHELGLVVLMDIVHRYCPLVNNSPESSSIRYLVLSSNQLKMDYQHCLKLNQSCIKKHIGWVEHV